jgi:hypothetical protein
MSQYPELCTFYGSQSEEVIASGERALGLKFPAIYRQFLSEYGAGTFRSTEIYGLIGNEAESSVAPDAVRLTLTTRSDVEIPSNYIIIYSVGDGEVFCLDVKDNDAPVVTFTPGLSVEEQEAEVVADDFGDFLLDRVQRQIERRNQLAV